MACGRVQASDGPITYLRVSVRAAEGFAINSMSGIIASPRRQPRLIGIELHARQARDVLERLYRAGYSCCPFELTRIKALGANWTAPELISFLRQQA